MGFQKKVAKFWGCSSVGRAPALQAGGRQFEPDQLHQNNEAEKARFERHLLGQPSPSRHLKPDQLHQNKWKGNLIPLFQKNRYKFAKGGEYIMVKVLVRDNNVEQALRVAKRKSQKEGLYREMKERQRYEKPTTKRKRLKEEAVRNEKKRQSKQRMVFGF